MYVPPYDSLLRAIGLDRNSVERADEVRVPRALFKFLLQTALAASEFDEKVYLKKNPDVGQSASGANELTPKQHYIGYGYFESRRGGLPKVDEAWYLRTYRDVAEGIASGAVASASEHFEIIGAAEGRAPSHAYIALARQWKELLNPHSMINY